MHAAPPYLLRLSADSSCLRVAVCDSLALTPRLRRYDDLAATGRGLQLVAHCSTSWGVTPNTTGKEVWAAVPYVEHEQVPPTMLTAPGTDVGPADGADAPARAVVRFLAVPVDAYLALQTWNDAVNRECGLIAALGPVRSDLPSRLVDLAIWLSGRFASDREGYREIVADARARGLDVIDLFGRWPEPVSPAVAAAEAFLAMVTELDGFCRTGVLLTEAPEPEVVRLRRWFVTETRSQLLEGGDPTPYPTAQRSPNRRTDQDPVG